jgi:hypothetical protein
MMLPDIAVTDFLTWPTMQLRARMVCFSYHLPHMQCFRVVYIKFGPSDVCASWVLVPLRCFGIICEMLQTYVPFQVYILCALFFAQQWQCFGTTLLLLQQISKCVLQWLNTIYKKQYYIFRKKWRKEAVLYVTCFSRKHNTLPKT